MQIVSISGFADLLLDEEVTPEEQREYLQIIRDESRRLAQLSGSVLLLNRIEAQTILTDCTDFSLDEQLRQCIIALVRASFQKNQLWSPGASYHVSGQSMPRK